MAKRWEVLQGKELTGTWELKDSVDAPDGCYWLDAFYQFYEHLPSVAECGDVRLIESFNAAPSSITTVPWAVVSNGQLFYIGHWACSENCFFLQEYEEPVSIQETETSGSFEFDPFAPNVL